MQIKVKAVIFDMDGVITDTMPYHFKAWRDIFKREKIHVTHEDIYKREGQKGRESVREIFSEKGLIYTDEKAEQLLKAKEELFKSTLKRRFILGSRSFIKSLRSQGFHIALVTGTSRHEATHLLPAQLMECFTASVCGCEVNLGKPHPEPYLNALKKLSIESKDAVVFENAPFGIRSAKAAGLKCFALETSLPKAFLKEADAVFSSYKEVCEKVKFIKA